MAEHDAPQRSHLAPQSSVVQLEAHVFKIIDVAEQRLATCEAREAARNYVHELARDPYSAEYPPVRHQAISADGGPSSLLLVGSGKVYFPKGEIICHVLIDGMKASDAARTCGYQLRPRHNFVEEDTPDGGYCRVSAFVPEPGLLLAFVVTSMATRTMTIERSIVFDNGLRTVGLGAYVRLLRHRQRALRKRAAKLALEGPFRRPIATPSDELFATLRPDQELEET